MKTLFVLFLAGTLCFTGAIALHAQPYSINSCTIDGGGGTSTGGVHPVSGIIGQHDAGGAMTAGNYALMGGFWTLYAVQTLHAPTLNIIPSGPDQAQISWTPNDTNYVVQKTTNLSLTNWTNSPSGPTNPIVVPATGNSKLYRLFKP